MDTLKLACPVLFLSTLSLRRATVKFSISGSAISDFYPRSPCGERPTKKKSTRQVNHFYPRSPCGERQDTPSIRLSRDSKTNYFYPRSPCGERPPLTGWAKSIAAISIHALLAESDFLFLILLLFGSKFLSTLSLRRATSSC